MLYESAYIGLRFEPRFSGLRVYSTALTDGPSRLTSRLNVDDVIVHSWWNESGSGLLHVLLLLLAATRSPADYMLACSRGDDVINCRNRIGGLDHRYEQLRFVKFFYT